MKNWKKYETQISDHFKKVYPDANIHHDHKQKGIISKTERQIDILIDTTIAGFSIKIVIDCKYFNKKIDIKIVESFIGMLQDLKVNKGIIITNKGYTAAALNRAKNDSYTDLDLKIINFSDLQNFIGFGAIIHRYPVSCFIESPPDWIIDGKTRNTDISLAYFYPKNKTFEEAIIDNNFVFTNIFLNINENFKIIDEYFVDTLIQSYVDFMFSNFKKLETISKKPFIKVDGSNTTITRITLHDKCIYKVFLNYDEYCIIFTLETAKNQIRKNLKNLKYIILRSKPIMVLTPGAPMLHQFFFPKISDSA